MNNHVVINGEVYIPQSIHHQTAELALELSLEIDRVGDSVAGLKSKMDRILDLISTAGKPTPQPIPASALLIVPAESASAPEAPPPAAEEPAPEPAKATRNVPQKITKEMALEAFLKEPSLRMTSVDMGERLHCAPATALARIEELVTAGDVRMDIKIGRGFSYMLTARHYKAPEKPAPVPAEKPHVVPPRMKVLIVGLNPKGQVEVDSASQVRDLNYDIRHWFHVNDNATLPHVAHVIVTGHLGSVFVNRIKTQAKSIGATIHYVNGSGATGALAKLVEIRKEAV